MVINRLKKNYILLQFLMTTRAEALLRLCKLDKALDDVNRVLESNPKHPHALAVRGDAMFQVKFLFLIRAHSFLQFSTPELFFFWWAKLREFSHGLITYCTDIVMLVLFQMCDFEHALVNYEKGLRVSVEPLLSRFLIGKTRASESVL